MKELNGRDLAGYIKERQAHDVRVLWQTHHVRPKLAIIVTVEHPAIDVYMHMKQRYGADILVTVETHRIKQVAARRVINQLNNDSSVHGIIVQLPLADPSQTGEIVDLVMPEKDVDALGKHAILDPATPMAILWLLAGYSIDLTGKKVVLVGRGKLVGAPLERILRGSGHDVIVVDSTTVDPSAITREADIVITATGVPNLITSDMLKTGAVIVDAGVAGEQGKIVGDVAPDVYERADLTITPTKGGVGPLTICALFENVIRAATTATQSR